MQPTSSRVLVPLQWVVLQLQRHRVLHGRFAYLIRHICHFKWLCVLVVGGRKFDKQQIFLTCVHQETNRECGPKHVDCDSVAKLILHLEKDCILGSPMVWPASQMTVTLRSAVLLTFFVGTDGQARLKPACKVITWLNDDHPSPKDIRITMNNSISSSKLRDDCFQ